MKLPLYLRRAQQSEEQRRTLWKSDFLSNWQSHKMERVNKHEQSASITEDFTALKTSLVPRGRVLQPRGKKKKKKKKEFMAKWLESAKMDVEPKKKFIVRVRARGAMIVLAQVHCKFNNVIRSILNDVQTLNDLQITYRPPFESSWRRVRRTAKRRHRSSCSKRNR